MVTCNVYDVVLNNGQPLFNRQYLKTYLQSNAKAPRSILPAMLAILLKNFSVKHLHT